MGLGFARFSCLCAERWNERAFKRGHGISASDYLDLVLGSGGSDMVFECGLSDQGEITLSGGLPPPSTCLGGAIGVGLCARRHRLPRLWRTAAPHCCVDRSRLSPSLSTRRRAPDRATTAYPPHPSKSGTSPHNLLLDATSLAVLPRRLASPSKSVYPRPISPYNKPVHPSGRAEPEAAAAPRQARGHIAQRGASPTPTPLDLIP